jgi:hypothetical protein
MDFQQVGWETDWIDLAQDRDKWRAVLNMVIRLWVPEIREISGLTEDLFFRFQNNDCTTIRGSHWDI